MPVHTLRLWFECFSSLRASFACKLECSSIKCKLEIKSLYTHFTFPTVIYNRGKVLESARENSKISSCFVLWGTAKKVTASDSAKPGPHIHIFFFNSGVTGTRRNGDKV